MTDAYATIKLLAIQQDRREIRLVVNQVSATGEGRTIRNQLQLVVDRFVCPHLNGGNSAAVPLDLLGEIPTDAVGARGGAAAPAAARDCMPGAPAALAVVAIAGRMVAC